jgi:hypothetical protein
MALTTSNSINVNTAQPLDDVAGAYPAHFSSDRSELETGGAGRSIKAFASILTGLTMDYFLIEKWTGLCPPTTYFVSNPALICYVLHRWSNLIRRLWQSSFCLGFDARPVGRTAA